MRNTGLDMNGELAPEFKTESGIRQGNSLTSLLFVMDMNFINTLCRNVITHTYMYLNLNPVVTLNLSYADNLLLI